MALPECLDTVVGLTNTECPCFITGDEPTGYDTSLSGLYLDDPEYGFPLKIPLNIEDCSTNDLWTRLTAARSAGIKQFITDMGANMLGGPMKRTADPFNGYVGDDDHTLNLTPDTFIAIKLEPKIYRGVVAKLHTVTLYLTGVNGQTINVEVHDEETLITGTAISDFDVSIAGGKGTFTFTTPELFDFQSAANQPRDLYLVINVGDYAGLQPRNNNTNCDCGKKQKWDKYFYAHGVSASTLAGLVDANESSYANGFRINMSVACGNSWLCQPFDYVNDAWARVMAEAIALYGMKKLAGMILTNPNPEKYTMITRDEIAFHRDRLNTLLSQRMPWLAQNMPAYATDCFTCNDKIKVSEYLV